MEASDADEASTPPHPGAIADPKNDELADGATSDSDVSSVTSQHSNAGRDEFLALRKQRIAENFQQLVTLGLADAESGPVECINLDPSRRSAATAVLGATVKKRVLKSLSERRSSAAARAAAAQANATATKPRIRRPAFLRAVADDDGADVLPPLLHVGLGPVELLQAARRGLRRARDSEDIVGAVERLFLLDTYLAGWVLVPPYQPRAYRLLALAIAGQLPCDRATALALSEALLKGVLSPNSADLPREESLQFTCSQSTFQALLLLANFVRVRYSEILRDLHGRASRAVSDAARAAKHVEVAKRDVQLAETIALRAAELSQWHASVWVRAQHAREVECFLAEIARLATLHRAFAVIDASQAPVSEKDATGVASSESASSPTVVNDLRKVVAADEQSQSLATLLAATKSSINDAIAYRTKALHRVVNAYNQHIIPGAEGWFLTSAESDHPSPTTWPCGRLLSRYEPADMIKRDILEQGDKLSCGVTVACVGRDGLLQIGRSTLGIGATQTWSAAVFRHVGAPNTGRNLATKPEILRVSDNKPFVDLQRACYDLDVGRVSATAFAALDSAGVICSTVKVLCNSAVPAASPSALFATPTVALGIVTDHIEALEAELSVDDLCCDNSHADEIITRLVASFTSAPASAGSLASSPSPHPGEAEDNATRPFPLPLSDAARPALGDPLPSAVPLQAPTTGSHTPDTSGGYWAYGDDERLIAAVGAFAGLPWVVIAAYVGTKTATQVRNRWLKTLLPLTMRHHIVPSDHAEVAAPIVGTPFFLRRPSALEEDIMFDRIRAFVAHTRPNDPEVWRRVAVGLPGRSADHCRSLFYNYLLPLVVPRSRKPRNEELQRTAVLPSELVNFPSQQHQAISLNRLSPIQPLMKQGFPSSHDPPLHVFLKLPDAAVPPPTPDIVKVSSADQKDLRCGNIFPGMLVESTLEREEPPRKRGPGRGRKLASSMFGDSRQLAVVVALVAGGRRGEPSISVLSANRAVTTYTYPAGFRIAALPKPAPSDSDGTLLAAWKNRISSGDSDLALQFLVAHAVELGHPIPEIAAASIARPPGRPPIPAKRGRPRKKPLLEEVEDISPEVAEISLPIPDPAPVIKSTSLTSSPRWGGIGIFALPANDLMKPPADFLGDFVVFRSTLCNGEDHELKSQVMSLHEAKKMTLATSGLVGFAFSTSSAAACAASQSLMANDLGSLTIRAIFKASVNPMASHHDWTLYVKKAAMPPDMLERLLEDHITVGGQILTSTSAPMNGLTPYFPRTTASTGSDIVVNVLRNAAQQPSLYVTYNCPSMVRHPLPDSSSSSSHAVTASAMRHTVSQPVYKHVSVPAPGAGMVSVAGSASNQGLHRRTEAATLHQIAAPANTPNLPIVQAGTPRILTILPEPVQVVSPLQDSAGCA